MKYADERKLKSLSLSLSEGALQEVLRAFMIDWMLRRNPRREAKSPCLGDSAYEMCCSCSRRDRRRYRARAAL